MIYQAIKIIDQTLAFLCIIILGILLSATWVVIEASKIIE